MNPSNYPPGVTGSELQIAGHDKPSNFDVFCNEYRETLKAARLANPVEYCWPLDQLDTVYGRMRVAFERGSYGKDSAAIRAVCKKLGIKHTYQAINAYLKS